jgi:hypothetical protein
MIFGKPLRHPFEKRIREIRKRVRPEPFDWYRFDSFSNLAQFQALVPGGLDALVQMAGDEPVADIGAADGDLSFVFESLGCRVAAIDWPGSNANQMAGIRLMKRELGSAIEIREVDLDDQFRIHGERFGLVLALGLLYHLKNPFYFLERLAFHSRYCVLSTVVLPPSVQEPVARLTADREFHDDPTNFWFFSESGLERLLDRCGWDLVRKNVPNDRCFCLIESRTAKTAATIRLLNGWHAAEQDAWRWTGREFGAVLDNVEGATRFEMRFRLPRPRRIRLMPAVNGVALPEREYATAGDHQYSCLIAAASRRTEVSVTIEGEMDFDGRELGVVLRLPPRTIVDESCGIRLL